MCVCVWVLLRLQHCIGGVVSHAAHSAQHIAASHCHTHYVSIFIIGLTQVCTVSADGHEYNGTISWTKNGEPCNPWSTITGIPFQLDGSEANFCRNPTRSPSGPWCYSGGFKNHISHKRLCDVPKCSKTKMLYSYINMYIHISTGIMYQTMVKVDSLENKQKA